MSYKQEFQSNNIDLQKLINLAKTLPDMENFDEELAVQDNLIAEIVIALQGSIEPKLAPYSCNATINTVSEELVITDINNNIIFEAYEITNGVFTVDFSKYVGETVIFRTEADYAFEIVIDDYNKNVPFIDDDSINPYAIGSEYYYHFTVPNYNITINITAGI